MARLSRPDAHLSGKDDGITALAPVRDRVPRSPNVSPAASRRTPSRLRAAESIGRPLGDHRFLASVERLTGRRLMAAKRGLKAN